MTRRNPPAKWPLPDVVNPEERICFRVPVPDNPHHIAAFRGAMLQLASAYNWADDVAHTAKDVALVWRDIIDNGVESEECTTTPIQFNQSGDCTLSVSFDGGATWTDIFNAHDCAVSAATAVIDGMINDGTIATPGQPPPGGELSPTQCHSWNVTLPAKGQWHCPVPVKAGYTVQVENASGGWWDGDVAAFWKCPSGKNYLLGACTTGETTVSTDPLPTAYHMRTVANVGTEWADVYNTTWTVPSTITDLTELYIQANDSVLDDNRGGITLKVTVCASGWCHTFDFTTGQHGFTPHVFALPNGEYVAGHGFAVHVDATDHAIILDFTLPASALVKTVSYHLTETGSQGTFYRSDSDTLGWYPGVSGVGVNATISSFTCGFTSCYGCPDQGEYWAGYMDSFTICGEGTEPTWE